MSLPHPLPEPPTGLPVGSYPRYVEAQRAVDFLSDNNFPVENVTIVGSDLKLVERVTGRLTQGRAIAIGAGGGAWWGLFVGILLSLFARSGASAIFLVIFGIVIGALFGVIFGWLAYRATGGHRDFTSRTQVVAGTYDVLCEPKHADEARNLLARLALQTGNL
ncbi:general stress protein [Actinopolymorpha alba]|uniref:general stress protein n=1 Tax=Actinopolymorpha alba TaxID=533267 RepID=UPI00037B1139|nr:general stress protein [Actinopolymorpha alba]